MIKSAIVAASSLLLLAVHTDAQSVDAAVVTSTIGVTKEHLLIKALGARDLDITYEIRACSVSAAAARAAFKADLIKLLPALLKINPTLKYISVSGGCPTVDVYGAAGYDNTFISAMFMRDDLDKVVWNDVQADDLFNQISSWRLE